MVAGLRGSSSGNAGFDFADKVRRRRPAAFGEDTAAADA